MPSNKTLVWPVFSLILLGIFIYFYEASRDQTQTVVIKDGGFFPAVIGIDPGTKVIFRNVGERSHWPASDFHPTHTLYPEAGGCLGSLLDACRGLKTGESF